MLSQSAFSETLTETWRINARRRWCCHATWHRICTKHAICSRVHCECQKRHHLWRLDLGPRHALYTCCFCGHLSWHSYCVPSCVWRCPLRHPSCWATMSTPLSEHTIRIYGMLLSTLFTVVVTSPEMSIVSSINLVGHVGVTMWDNNWCCLRYGAWCSTCSFGLQWCPQDVFVNVGGLVYDIWNYI